MIIDIVLRKGTKSQFIKANPLLLKNEIAVEKNTKQVKIGDGKTLYNNLPYATKNTLINRLHKGFTLKAGYKK